MRKAIIVGVLIVLSLPASARTVMAIAPEFGSIYCLQWTNLRKKGAGETDARVQWVIGYLAGWAATRDRSQKNCPSQ